MSIPPRPSNNGTPFDDRPILPAEPIPEIVPSQRNQPLRVHNGCRFRFIRLNKDGRSNDDQNRIINRKDKSYLLLTTNTYRHHSGFEMQSRRMDECYLISPSISIYWIHSNLTT